GLRCFAGYLTGCNACEVSSHGHDRRAYSSFTELAGIGVHQAAEDLIASLSRGIRPGTILPLERTAEVVSTFCSFSNACNRIKAPVRANGFLLVADRHSLLFSERVSSLWIGLGQLRVLGQILIAYLRLIRKVRAYAGLLQTYRRCWGNLKFPGIQSLLIRFRKGCRRGLWPACELALRVDAVELLFAC